ncbi:multicopper oxidase family protein [Pseudonocardia cypriaca]|uniref:FtsP/CotA-like multicopper oxidase with cupredoxin domain n=1 Tax=Pseudonocardia cypriaca TaxID=882449 RepID=A0A543GC21_9PSEU|nr:multicopper oxidase family protein [Pseudonocardia cypriaca]TQM43620.1 FtsP/CotA-like multicopper oxidase with cupredoxin domain [Pseudonocardia cypriaca]
MFEPLAITDMVLALLAMIAGLVVGRRAAGPTARLRRWLSIMAALVAARLVVALLILTGGTVLAESRLVVQVPLAVLPVAWAVRRPSRTAAQVAAAGVLLSGWWLFVPFGAQDTWFVLAGSTAALVAIAALGRWRRSGSRASRMPWPAVALLLVPAVGLALAGQANAAAAGHHHSAAGGISVDQLTGPRDREPDVRVTLTAARGEVRLASGHAADALLFNGTAPGPEIRAEVGQLVEVTLVNSDVEEGVSLHWHGVDVPNAEDGVPGVTQNAVRPGGRHVYRFVPNRSGTFWYHTHRDALRSVERGLFGALVVEDAGRGAAGFERTLFTHRWPAAAAAITAFDRADQPTRQAVEAGREVRLRLINSSAEPNRVHVGGTPFTVAAIDGNPIEGAAPVGPGTDLLLAAGGRYDLTFTMPDGPVTLAIDASAALALSPGGTAVPAAPATGALFDPFTYGSGAAPAPDDHDRTFDLRLDDGFGFGPGGFGYVSSSINGRLYPAVPTLEVVEGERVKVRIANRSIVDHPMHLHGHRVRVLSRNGVPAAGGAWWTDTLNVAPGEVFEIAFTADNPGIWMDHCHNFEHGANGMILHLAYEGVTTPYSADHAPE